ncbi:hypothetical protein F4780DRAFT_524535 [Xylariomycetidae sp. FL0641]|nr:hypothetical protein F4780DRAFT_524535 [Xylariomycetidae sp. FL0641]
MADTQKPPAKKPLPFKRTIKRKSSQESSQNDDGLSLFSRSKEFFPSVIEDQQRRAREKAERAERERKEKLARKQKEEQDALDAQLAMEEELGRKRRKTSLDDDDDDDLIPVWEDSTPPESRKPSSASLRTPSTRRESRRPISEPRSGSKNKTPVVTLDDSDEEDAQPSNSGAAGSGRASSSRPVTSRNNEDSDSDSDMMMWENSVLDNPAGNGEDEDPAAVYIRAAMERLEKKNALRKAREKSQASGSPAAAAEIEEEPDPSVSILIVSEVPETKPLLFKYKTRRNFSVLFDTWRAAQVQHHPPLRHDLDRVLFTWQRTRLYPTSSLEGLGVRPAPDGRLVPSSQSAYGTSFQRRAQDDAERGFGNRDHPDANQQHVLFEAWTPALWAEMERAQEAERQRRLAEDAGGGGGGDEDMDADPGALPDLDDDLAGTTTATTATRKDADARVRVVLKARGLPDTKISVHSYTTAAEMARAFRGKNKVPDHQAVELRWDGEALEPDITVEEADIEDMDSVEVYVR